MRWLSLGCGFEEEGGGGGVAALAVLLLDLAVVRGDALLPSLLFFFHLSASPS